MKRIAILIFLFLFSGCGGGTSGTSPTSGFVQKQFEGELSDQNGVPLSNAKVEIQSTGDSTTTDSKGAFSILATVPVGRNDVIVTSQTGQRYLVAVVVAEDEETVVLRLVFSQQATDIYRNWQISARVGGEGCESAYFETAGSDSQPDPFGRTQSDFDQQAEDQGFVTIGLMQVEEVRAGTKCYLSIEILKDGNPVPNLDYKAQVRTCKDNETSVPDVTFTMLANGGTGTGGAVKVPFTVAARDVCGYEVTFPHFGDLRLGALVEVQTKFGLDKF